MADILPDLPGDLDDDEIGFDDAFALAFKIEEMRRKIDAMEKIVPGTRATTTIEIDGVSYVLTLARQQAKS